MCGGQFITEKRVDQSTAAAASVAASAGESKPLDAQQQAAPAAPHTSTAAVSGVSSPSPASASATAQGQQAQARATKRRARNDSTGSRESVPPGAGRGDEASVSATGHTRSSGRSQRRPPGRPRKISRSGDPDTGIRIFVHTHHSLLLMTFLSVVHMTILVYYSIHKY